MPKSGTETRYSVSMSSSSSVSVSEMFVSNNFLLQRNNFLLFTSHEVRLFFYPKIENYELNERIKNYFYSRR